MNSLDYFSNTASSKPNLHSKLCLKIYGLVKAAGLLPSDRSQAPPDFVTTPHNKTWFDSELFQKCYQASIHVAGFDYRIPWRVQQLLWCIASTQRIPGQVVEIGSGKGFMMAAAAEYQVIVGISREIHLFDLFQKPEVSGEGDVRQSAFYAETPDAVKERFSRYPFVRIHVGDIRRTLSAHAPSRISFLHVDLNNSQLEVECLEFLLPSIVRGGMILLDDFANRGYESAFMEIGHFFKNNQLAILATPSGQGIIVNQ